MQFTIGIGVYNNHCMKLSAIDFSKKKTAITLYIWLN